MKLAQAATSLKSPDWSGQGCRVTSILTTLAKTCVQKRKKCLAVSLPAGSLCCEYSIKRSSGNRMAIDDPLLQDE